jgi:hypothetical protein
MKPALAILSVVLFFAASAAQAHVAQTPSAGFAPKGGGATNVWWTDRQAGLIGGVAGSVVGVLGGVVGMLAGFGKARRLTLSLVAGLIVFGVACLSLGTVAVLMSQPYAVYYPLLLMGLLCTLIFGINFPVIRRSYALRELRKMEALDT